MAGALRQQENIGCKTINDSNGGCNNSDEVMFSNFPGDLGSLKSEEAY